MNKENNNNNSKFIKNNKQNNYSNNYQKTEKSSFKDNSSSSSNNKQINSQQQKSPYISNFWISTLKSRSSTSSSTQRSLQNATERLQQLHQQSSSSSFSPLSQQSSSSSPSFLNNSEDKKQINNLENQQNNFGVVESVAVRSANFLMEMKRTQEDKNKINNNIFTSKNNCGRVTPLPTSSPSLIEQQQQQLFDEIQSSSSSSFLNNNKNNNNCGHFPIIDSEKNKQLFINICEEKEEINNSKIPLLLSSQSFSSSSSSISELPQPPPKHHIRQQLLKIKQKNVFASGNSFFGGISNNPFFFGGQQQQKQIKQRKLLPTAKQLLNYSSSSPNFPQTNTVISRVFEFEEKQQKNNVSSTKRITEKTLINNLNNIKLNNSTNNIKKLSSTNNLKNNNNNRLSPKSSLFCKKPVIVVDLDGLEEEKEEENKKINLNKIIISSEKSKSVTALIKLNNVTPKHFQFTIQKSSPSTSPRNSTDKTETYDINKQSPRWRTDSINEALPAFNNNKKEKLPLIGELKQKPSTLIENKTKLLPLTNNSSLPVDNVNNNKLENKSPLETPSSSTTITTTNNLLPSIKQNNEKEKINIKEEEEENKYLNGNSILNNKINNNENISSTFLPQTAIQISALQAQQLKNAKSPPPIEHKNDLLIQNNNSEIINQQSNNNLEKQFSSSLSPPPCYQQALRLSPILAGRLAGIPKFHFPMGRPLSKAENDAKLNRIKDLFQSFPDGKISFADFDELCKRMDMAIYTKRAVYDACCRINGLTIFSPSTSTSIPENEQNLKNLLNLPNIDFNQFIIYWNRMCSEAHDEATQFIFTLNSASRSFNSHFLRKEDFLPILMDLILTHPGLHFLKEAPQFYSKYCEVVIVRIFWNVNRSWSGKITASELRRSNFLQTLKMLDTVTDINRITDYFSYEHFYVTYCKFWELDTDHDMVISRDDMKRHCNGALTDRIIDRIFSAAVLRTPTEQKTILGLGPVKQQPIETIGFEDFVCFLLAEEDKRHPTSVEYWFRCLDLDGDGQISLYEMEYFYEAIEQKLNSKNMETLALRDVICNLLDSISSSNGYSITRNDLKRSGLAHRFFNTFVNWIKYVDQESSDGERASVKTVGDKEISDWEVFCLTEYELLMSETEQISNEEEEEEEGIEDENIDLVLDEDDELEDSSFTTTLLNEEREQRLHGFLQHQQKQQNNHLIA